MDTRVRLKSWNSTAPLQDKGLHKLTLSLLSDKVVSAEDTELVRILSLLFMSLGDWRDSSLSLGGSRDFISIILRTAC